MLGDDLALNAEQVSGVRAERELPVIWAVAKGSMVNKAILVPAALAVSALAPWAVIPLLMLGGLFLCFEGFEKIAHKLLHSEAEDHAHRAELARALLEPAVDFAKVEQERIKGAVRTDFILSAEIVTIAGTVATAPFVTRLGVLVGIAVVMTAVVYGLVAAIVKLDDVGLHLSRSAGGGGLARLRRRLGSAVLAASPYLMRFLSVAGTAAMFLVGGGILAHGISPLHHWKEGLVGAGGIVAGAGPVVVNALTGIIAGGVAVAAVKAGERLFGRGVATAEP